MQETICLQCGDRGFTNALVHCVRCLKFAVHRYCLDILPKTVDEFVHWTCDDCSLGNKNQTVGNQYRLMRNNTAAVRKKEPIYDGVDRNQSYNSCAKYESVKCAELSNRCCSEEFTVSDEKKRWITSSSQQLEKEKNEGNLMQQNTILRETSQEESLWKRKRRIISLSDKEKKEKNLHRVDNSLCKRPSEESTIIDGDYIRSSKKKDHQDFSGQPWESHAKPGTAASCILSCNGCSSRICQKRTARSSEANMVYQRQGIIFSQHERENKGLCLEKHSTDLSTVERSVDQNDNLNEIRKSGTTKGKTPACNDMGSLPEELPNDLDIASTIDCCAPAEPVLDPIWRGSFNIWNKEELIDSLMAHMSSRACEKAYEEARLFPLVLQLELLPKLNAWPRSFETLKPSGVHIALYFFPSNISSERVYDNLVDEMLIKELAMRAIVQNAELLVFTSIELQLPYWRFRGKYYLWGVFREKQQSHLSASQSCERELSGNPKKLAHALLPGGNSSSSNGRKVGVAKKAGSDVSSRSNR